MKMKKIIYIRISGYFTDPALRFPTSEFTLCSSYLKFSAILEETIKLYEFHGIKFRSLPGAQTVATTKFKKGF